MFHMRTIIIYLLGWVWYEEYIIIGFISITTNKIHNFWLPIYIQLWKNIKTNLRKQTFFCSNNPRYTVRRNSLQTFRNVLFFFSLLRRFWSSLQEKTVYVYSPLRRFNVRRESRRRVFSHAFRRFVRTKHLV